MCKEVSENLIKGLAQEPATLYEKLDHITSLELDILLLLVVFSFVVIIVTVLNKEE